MQRAADVGRRGNNGGSGWGDDRSGGLSSTELGQASMHVYQNRVRAADSRTQWWLGSHPSTATNTHPNRVLMLRLLTKLLEDLLRAHQHKYRKTTVREDPRQVFIDKST